MYLVSKVKAQIYRYRVNRGHSPAPQLCGFLNLQNISTVQECLPFYYFCYGLLLKKMGQRLQRSDEFKF